MAADVVEAAHFPGVVPHEEQRFAGNLGGEVVARLSHLGYVPGNLPGAGKDLLFLLAKNFRIEVEAGGKRPGASEVGIDMEWLGRTRHSGRLYRRPGRSRREAISIGP